MSSLPTGMVTFLFTENLRRAGFAEGELPGLTGAFIPFARTRAERLARGDPRLSPEERYGTQDAYVAAAPAGGAAVPPARGRASARGGGAGAADLGGPGRALSVRRRRTATVGELPRGRSVAGRRGHFLRLEIDCGVAGPSDCRDLDKLRADEPDRVGSGRKQAQVPARAAPTRGEQGRRPQGKGCIPTIAPRKGLSELSPRQRLKGNGRRSATDGSVRSSNAGAEASRSAATRARGPLGRCAVAPATRSRTLVQHREPRQSRDYASRRRT
jgi:hypothetical protein